MICNAKRLNAHFARCVAITTVLSFNTQHADATIQYSGAVYITIPPNFAGLYLNVVTGATGNSAASVPGWTINPYSNDGLKFWVSTSPTTTQHIIRTGSGAVANLTYADVVGPNPIYGGWNSLNLDAATTGNQPFILNSANNFYGFRFTYNGGTHYGWARISLSSSLTAQPRKLVEYMWDDQPDRPIAIWQYLEPWGACCSGATCYDFNIEGTCSGVWYEHTLCSVNPCNPPPPPCPADIAPPGGDHSVNVNDLLAVINQWGRCPAPPTTCPADVTQDNNVNVNDLLFIINHWGLCP